MIEDFFDHTCDIFHVIESQRSPGYGLPGTADFSYPDTPDIVECACHFHVSDSMAMAQAQPQTDYSGKIKVGFPAGTEVRINDVVRHRESGLSYRLELPKNIRGHHIIAYAQRYGKDAPI